ncbi:MAG: hypothetical protein PHD57_01480 [Desulfobacterales bacterium]|jgi:preprotein translocase subunit SecB|nr:hypothetical protein [Desulfobacterales bacterium]MDD3950742.1 hypothetical protein [Desulfobacterales bacterium]
MAPEFKITSISLAEAHFPISRQYKWKNGKPIELLQYIEIQYQQRPEKSIRVLVSVSSDSDKQPFRFSVAWEGSFVFEEKPLKEAPDRIAHIHCATIKFACVRQFVADLARRENPGKSRRRCGKVQTAVSIGRDLFYKIRAFL